MHTQTIGEKVGNPGNERILLEKDGFILELGQFEDDRSFGNLTTPEDVWRSKVHGINKLSFLVNDINLIHSAMQQANVQIDFELTETNAMTGDRYFMIQDDFDCSIQFFEIDQ